MAKIEEELKGLLLKMKQESEKVGLTFSSTFRKLRPWHPVPSLQANSGEKVETVADYFGGRVLQNHCR